MLSCLIADDHALMRGALVALVERHWPEAAIVEAADFPSAWREAAMFTDPALCLVDLDMPGAPPMAGIEALKAANNRASVIVVTGMADDQVLRDLLALDVAGFVPKTASPGIMQAAIALVLAGGRYLPSRVAELLNRPARTEPGLTTRQVEVVRLLACGRSNKEIALALGLSPATVKTHVAQVLAAIGASNRTEAAVRARNMGLV